MTPAAARVDAAYRRRLAALRDAIVAKADEAYQRDLDPDDIGASFEAFAARFLPTLVAGQAALQSLASAYVRGFLSAELRRPVELVPQPRLAGTTREGKPIAEAMGPIAGMVLGAIGQRKPVDEAVDFGRYLTSRLVDNELTGAADRVVEHQSEALAPITGWEGVVQEGACETCVSRNSGTHGLDEELYRHGSCHCDRRLIVA